MGILQSINRFVWGIPTLILIICVGVYLSLQSGFAQFRLFPKALRNFAGKLRPSSKCSGGVSQFQALCTALAATVGTGNIAGVAGAIAIGGPGAIFWMWICAFLGMITKFAEATLAVRYRKKCSNGNYIGGPMYIIEYGMGKKWRYLAVIYCFFGVVAAFGIGNATQINAVIDGLNSVIVYLGGTTSQHTNVLFGCVFAVVLSAVLLGGAKRVGRFAELLVPVMSVGYILLCLGVLVCCCGKIPAALLSIIQGAFSPQAVTGGMVGSAFTALRIGASRGVFTNEAGMGTAAMAHASATVSHPVQQGLMGIVEVFLDTVLICTLTALVILCSGVYIPFGLDEGFLLTERAFSMIYGPWISVPLALFLCCFAFATMIGWGLYGLRCAQYLFGEEAWKIFVILQAVAVIASTFLQTATIWLLAETVNGLMAIPNLIALAALTPQLKTLLDTYNRKSERSD